MRPGRVGGRKIFMVPVERRSGTIRRMRTDQEGVYQNIRFNCDFHGRA
jgi:hypothetical protein